MAWLQTDPSGNYHISFRFGGSKFKRSLKTKSERDANSRLHRLEENIRLVESGRLELPSRCDAPKFLLSDGKLDRTVEVKPVISLSQLFDIYFDALPNGALEDTTIYGMEIHRRHLERHLGKRFRVQQLAQNDLQKYVTKRSKEKGIRGRTLSAVTIRKEVATLRAIWNWAVTAAIVEGSFPNRRLKYPKTHEKPRFQTWQEIETQIEAGDLSEEQQRDLWDCLFLSTEEVAELLKYVKKTAKHPFIYPMFVAAAHTGARRSELLRSELSDFDRGFATIRERKRVRGQLSTRRVPVSCELAKVLDDWRAAHPGGSFTFCLTVNGRPTPISHDDANEHVQRTLAGGKWSVIRGWHCLRHSFCSNCAMKGIDQRLIDSWVGHSTESMRRRYRHLFPSHESAAIKLLFE